ncbi:MAG TPA: trypsin-like peptidase domain-containing protein [Lacipirellulaceae bacterium]|nr:trypsin-like peptidase domain-containing protein [Lacipirellulaceae bacterium]
MVRLTAAAIAILVSFVGSMANAQQILMLDFWSPQCGPCMQMKPLMHSFEQAGYPIREVDTTRNYQLSQQYNVTQIPCFVMLVNGREVERQIGATSTESLQQMFDRAKQAVSQQQRIRFKDPDQSPQNNAPVSRGPATVPPQTPSGQPWPTGNTTPTDRPLAGSDLSGASLISPENAKLVNATVRLYVDDPKGRDCGTGTIVDTRSGEALVVTCGHLFTDSKGKSPVKVDLFEAGDNGVHVVGHATGQVISYDLARDVALVSIRPDRPVTVVHVAPPHTSVDRGDRVVGIGCSHGNDPTVMDTRVTSVDRYQGPPNIEASGAPAIGRSGGGLFNAKGELIGVCNNADPEGNEGIYAGLDSIHQELDRLGLKEIYAKSDPTQSAHSAVAISNSAGGPSVVRGQEPPIASAVNDSSAGTVSNAQSSPAPPHNLSDTEQAALEEVMSRAEKTEVVCIVRPKDAGGQSEVITLDNVSPDFVRALREHSKTATMMRQAHKTTSPNP